MFKELLYKLGLGDDPQNPDYGYGKRLDGTNKGLGYFGMLQNLEDPRLGSSELSYTYNRGNQTLFAPGIVPTLNADELRAVLSNKNVTPEIHQKIIDHALMRQRAGKSPFAGPGEQIAPPPGIQPYLGR